MTTTAPLRPVPGTGARTVHAPRSATAPRFSVVIPSYCEPRIGETVTHVRDTMDAAGLHRDEVEIVVVDDGSPDDSHLLAVAAGADRVIVLARNRGKGAAVRAGMLAARGRVVAFTDADLAYAPEQLLALLTRVEGGADVVVGNRAHPASQAQGQTGRGRAVGSRVINRLVRTALRESTALEDTQCGLKAFRAEAAQTIFGVSRVDGFAFDVEVLHLAHRFGFAVTDVPVTVTNSPRSTVSVGRDAARLARDLLRIRRWARSGAYDGATDDAPAGTAPAAPSATLDPAALSDECAA